MSSGFSHYLHSLCRHRNTPGQSWWAVATNTPPGVSQHLPFLVLTPACLAVDALPVCFSAAVSPQVVTRAISRLREVLPVVGEETAKSGACLCDVLVLWSRVDVSEAYWRQYAFGCSIWYVCWLCVRAGVELGVWRG